MILSRSEIVSHYLKLLAHRLGKGTEIDSWVGLLPPYLCRCLVLGTALGTACKNVESAFVGTSKGVLANCSGLRVSIGPFSQRLFNQLPLKGHIPLDVPGLTAWIQKAFKLLSTLDPSSACFVRDWCSLVVWVAPDVSLPPDTLLTSVAIPTLPHCTLLSVKSLRHIPAKHIYEGASLYALAENLYHEALHQQLSATLIFGPPLLRKSKSCSLPIIDIPWRNARWELDRVLHATWVYGNIQRLRRKALSSSHLLKSEDYLVEAAEHDTKSKVTLLVTALSNNISWLSADGKTLAAKVQDEILIA